MVVDRGIILHEHFEYISHDTEQLFSEVSSASLLILLLVQRPHELAFLCDVHRIELGLSDPVSLNQRLDLSHDLVAALRASWQDYNRLVLVERAGHAAQVLRDALLKLVAPKLNFCLHFTVASRFAEDHEGESFEGEGVSGQALRLVCVRYLHPEWVNNGASTWRRALILSIIADDNDSVFTECVWYVVEHSEAVSSQLLFRFLVLDGREFVQGNTVSATQSQLLLLL